MALPAPIKGLISFITLFLAFRFNDLSEIWDKFEEYQNEIDREYAKYITDEIFHPLQKELESAYTSSLDSESNDIQDTR